MGILPMDMCTHTLDAQRRTQSRSDLLFPRERERERERERGKSRWRGELDRAAPDVREYTHPWAGRPCYVSHLNSRDDPAVPQICADLFRPAERHPRRVVVRVYA